MTDGRVTFQPRVAVINVCANIHSTEKISTAPNRNSDQIMGHHDKSSLFFQPQKLLSIWNLMVQPHRLVVKIRIDTPKQNIYIIMGVFSENGLWTLTAVSTTHNGWWDWGWMLNPINTIRFLQLKIWLGIKQPVCHMPV